MRMHRTPPAHCSAALFFLACVTAFLLLGLDAQRQEIPATAPLPAPPSPSLTQTVAEISANDLRLHVTALASEAMDGRLTGTEGERRATDYVAAVFASLGLEPAGDKGTFFQSFEFTAGVSLGTANRLVLHTKQAKGARSKEQVSLGTINQLVPRKDVAHGTQEYAVNQEWRPLAFSKTGVFNPAEVVFAGYGIVAAAADGYDAYDSYAHLEVGDHWVPGFRYGPEGLS